MENTDFSPLHPNAHNRFRNCVPTGNPISPSPTPHNMGGRGCVKHIFIESSQLFYDIDAVTAIVSRSRRTDSGAQDNTLSTSEQDGYRPMFFRWFDKYIKRVESRLQAFIVKPIRVAQMNELREWDERELVLLMPQSWDDTGYEDLADAIHHYIVNGALVEYFSLTLTSKDPVLMDKAAQLEEEYDNIKNLSCAVKPGWVSKRLKPF